MLWKSITLDDYLPFSHCGNKHVKVEFDQPATAILGNNGSGKSSLLRALTPYPAVRTDFGKANGKIEKVLVHDGEIYTLTSDFKNNPAAPHSFKKGDVELNLSGTTETQKDLVEEHFGISKLILDILFGNIRICSLGKSERRSLFSCTYPSDLTFVLEYHKKICSDIRACSNQLKLLGNREATLRSYLIDDAQRERMIAFRDNATKLVDVIDKTVLLLSAETNRYKVELAKLEASGKDTGMTEQDMVYMVNAFTKHIREGLRKSDVWRKHLYSDSEYKEIMEVASTIEAEKKALEVRMSWMTEKAAAIRDELNKFETLKNAAEMVNDKSNMEARLKELERELVDIEKFLGSAVADCVPYDKCDYISGSIVPMISKFVENFHMQNVKLQPQEALFTMRRRLDEIILTKSTYRTEIERAESEIKDITARLDKLERRPYPVDCTRTCMLRDAVADNINQLKGKLDGYTNSKKAREQDILTLEEEQRKLDAEYREQAHLHNLIERDLMPLIRNNGLEAIAFCGESVHYCLNEHPTAITNRVIQSCDITYKRRRHQEIVSEIESIRASLSALATADSARISSDVITDLLSTKGRELETLIVDMNTTERNIKDKAEEHAAVFVLWQDICNLGDLIRNINHQLNMRRYKSMIEFNDQLSNELLHAKHDISTQLFSYNKTLDSQQKHKDVLELEILPTTEKIKAEKHKLSVVADALSPNHGLPCIHLTRFINRIISKANAFIKRVWLYDMEIVYLEEGKDLDFTLEVIIRGSTTVKDISVLSAGQQAIVNLAVTLAICTERGWFDKYPMMADEVDAPLTDEHRARLVELLSDLIETGEVKQLMLVNHFAIQTGMSRCDNVCLSTDGIVLPEEYNAHCEIN